MRNFSVNIFLSPESVWRLTRVLFQVLNMGRGCDRLRWWPRTQADSGQVQEGAGAARGRRRGRARPPESWHPPGSYGTRRLRESLRSVCQKRPSDFCSPGAPLCAPRDSDGDWLSARLTAHGLVLALSRAGVRALVTLGQPAQAAAAVTWDSGSALLGATRRPRQTAEHTGRIGFLGVGFIVSPDT